MKRISLLLHRWVGLVVGLVVALLGVTGSVLVYGEALDRTLNPDLLEVRPAGERMPPGRALSVLRGAEFELRPELIHLPGEASDPYVFQGVGPSGTDRREAFVDPYRGEVLGTRTVHAGVVGTLFRLHVDLLGGEVGRQAVGWLGILLLVLCVTGAVVWWPRVARLRLFLRAFGVRWSAGARRTNYDLHRAGGAWTLPYLALLALTGSGLVFYGTTGEVLNAATGSQAMPPPPRSTPPAGATEAGTALSPDLLDRAWTEARDALPGASFSYVYLPTDATAPIGFRARLPGELHPNGRSFVWLDRWTGRRLRVDDATRADVGPRLLHALYPLHIGAFDLGPVDADVVRFLWALLGLAPAVLIVSGFLVWWWRGRPVP